MGKYKVIDYEKNEFKTAEEVRLLLRYLGEDFEDVRIPRDGAKVAEEAVPFGSLPALEENGKIVAIHTTMARYIAHKHDIAGKTIEEKLDCGMVLEGLRHFLLPLMFTAMKKTNEDERKAAVMEYFKENASTFFGHLEKFIKQRQDKEYLVSNEITWCDLSLGAFCCHLLSRFPPLLDSYPLLKAFGEKMNDVPAIKERKFA